MTPGVVDLPEKRGILAESISDFWIIRKEELRFELTTLNEFRVLAFGVGKLQKRMYHRPRSGLQVCRRRSVIASQKGMESRSNSFVRHSIEAAEAIFR